MSNAAGRTVRTTWSIPPAWPTSGSDTSVRLAPTTAASWVPGVAILAAIEAPWLIHLIPGTSAPLGPILLRWSCSGASLVAVAVLDGASTLGQRCGHVDTGQADSIEVDALVHTLAAGCGTHVARPEAARLLHFVASSASNGSDTTSRWPAITTSASHGGLPMAMPSPVTPEMTPARASHKSVTGPSCGMVGKLAGGSGARGGVRAPMCRAEATRRGPASSVRAFRKQQVLGSNPSVGSTPHA